MNSNSASNSSNSNNNLTADDIRNALSDMGVHVYLDTDELNTRLQPGMSKKINRANQMTSRRYGVVTG